MQSKGKGQKMFIKQRKITSLSVKGSTSHQLAIRAAVE